MKKKWKELFEHPGRSYHSLPFWGWNDVLTEEEVKAQVQAGAEAGVGGFFLHSREGLETPYMGEQWFSCMEQAVSEGKKQGMQMWLYDEDRWPSGTAGGLVTSQGDAYRCKGLTLEILNSGEVFSALVQERWQEKDDAKGIQALYAAGIRDMEMDRFRIGKKQAEQMKKEGPEAFESFLKSFDGRGFRGVYLLVRLEVSAGSEWFNWEAPPDQLNPETAERFIACTHEKYKERFGAYFGNVIPGIFTDEPSLHDRHAYFGEKRGWIPWTYGFSGYFREQKGYDFLDDMPWLYFNGGESAKIRHDYWQALSRQYGNAYFKTIGDWCRKNNLKFTGHFLQEDKMGLCARVNGSVMPHYIYQDVPGIDMLTEQTGEFLTVKQCTSVASQYEKPEVLTETYGCTGWDFTFEGQKWMGDWQFVLGVTRRCQHIALYSLRGCRKRDYPPSFNYNVNWWKENRFVEEYFARLSAVLTQGRALRRVLLLHPVSTVWSRLGVSPYGNPVRRNERDVPELDRFGNEFNDLLEAVLRRHFDCDLGDEELLMADGSVEGGKLRLKACDYDAVVVPEMDTIYPSTCRLLKAFGEAGGMVLFLGKRPELLEGRADAGQAVKAIPGRELSGREELWEALEEFRTVSVREEAGNEAEEILYQLRRIDGELALFLVNNDRKKTVTASVSITGKLISELESPDAEGGAAALLVEALGLMDGSVKAIESHENAAGDQSFLVTLPPVGSAMYWISKARKEIAFPIAGETQSVSGRISLGPSFSYRLTHENVLPLDRCRFSLNGGPWSEPMEVWQAQQQVRQSLGMRQINLNGMEQRYKWIGLPHEKDGTPLKLSFGFVSEEGGEALELLMEIPESFTVSFNGREVSGEDRGWFLDKSFRRILLGEARRGENEILLSCAYQNRMELENIYLAGTFGVSEDRHLVRLFGQLSAGDWCRQGLGHYCGSVIYQMEYDHHGEGVRRVFLRLPKVKATALILRLGGKELPILWNLTAPVEITPWLSEGKNLLELEVIASPRNMLGPFHGAEARPKNVHDASFCPKPEEYYEGYRLVEYGILEAPEIMVE